MKLEVVVRPESPIPRETVERQVSQRLEHPEAEAGEIAGKLGWSTRCSASLRFVRGADGESDRAHVESIDLELEFEDARDVESVVEWCRHLESALKAPLYGRDGRPIDSTDLATLFRASKRAEWRFRAVLGVVGLLAIAAGALCLYGFDYQLDFIGPGTHHARLTKPGMALCVVGVVLVTMALAGSRASKPLGSRPIDAKED